MRFPSYATFNLISLCFGMAALFLPVLALTRDGQKPDREGRLVISAVSFFSCAVSLCAQVFETLLWVERGDWSGLKDTHGALAALSLMLLVLTVLFNALLLRNRRRYDEKA